MAEFKRITEARGIDAFWESRKENRLRKKPEAIAQALLALFASGVVDQAGLVIREFASGVGFVDVGLSFRGVLHLIELKILKGTLTGVSQLARYMVTESRRTAWLVLIDVRRANKWAPVTQELHVAEGKIRILQVNVNPTAPHLLN
jgi:RecB family endonuclease NucS